MGFDVGTLMRQPAFANPVESLLKQESADEFLAKCKQQGLDFKDLFHHTIAAVSTIEGEANTNTLILQTRVPVNQNKIRDAARNARAQRFAGKTYFRVDEDQFTYLFMPSDNIIIFSNMDEPQLQSLIKSGGSQAALPADQLAMVRDSEKNHLWLVMPFDQRMRMAIQGSGQAFAMQGPDQRVLSEAFGKAKGLSIAGRVEGDLLKFQGKLACADESSAQLAVNALQNIWNTQMPMLRAMLGQVGGVQQNLLGEFVQNTKFSSQAATAEMAGQLSVRNVGSLLSEAARQGSKLRGTSRSRILPRR
jgi:hypothetical protein